MSDPIIIPNEPTPGPPSSGRPADLAAPPEPPPEPAKTYDETYVKSLQDEAVKYRQRVRQYEDAFDGYSSEEQSAILEWAKLSRKASGGDEEAIAALVEQGLWEAPEPEPQDQPDYVTKADLEALLRDRDERASEAANVGYLHSEARKLGYEPNTPDYDLLISIAQRIPSEEFEGGRLPLDLAHEKVQAHYRTQWEKWAEGKLTDSRQSLTFPTSGGQPVLPAETAKTPQEARERAFQRLLADQG